MAQFGQQAGGGGLVERVEQVILLAHGAFHHRDRERRPRDRRHGQDGLGRLGQPRNPAGDHVPQLIRRFELAGFGQVGEDLANEERVAVRLAVEPARQSRPASLERRRRIEQRRDPALVEPAERDPLDADVRRQIVQRMPLGVAVGDDDHRIQWPGRQDQVSQEHLRRRWRPVEVVEHEHGAPSARGRIDEVADRIEQREPLGLGIQLGAAVKRGTRSATGRSASTNGW